MQQVHIDLANFVKYTRFDIYKNYIKHSKRFRLAQLQNSKPHQDLKLFLGMEYVTGKTFWKINCKFFMLCNVWFVSKIEKDPVKNDTCSLVA